MCGRLNFCATLLRIKQKMFIFSRCINDIITTFWYSFWLLTCKTPSGVSFPGSSLLWLGLWTFMNVIKQWIVTDRCQTEGQKFSEMDGFKWSLDKFLTTVFSAYLPDCKRTKAGEQVQLSTYIFWKTNFASSFMKVRFFYI